MSIKAVYYPTTTYGENPVVTEKLREETKRVRHESLTL